MTSSENEAVVSLTDDGISEELFALLWTKDELNFGPSINIPDTVIFRYGQPTLWYFTASNGRVKRKNRQNLLSAKIEEAFTKQILGYDIVATFVSVPIEKDLPSGKVPSNTVEFLDRKGLSDFLYQSKKDNHGILQRFIEPKGIKNEIIRAIWSPKVCLLERAENIHNLHDPRYGLYERCVTFEGPEYYSVSAPLRGPVLAGQIQKVCESVVAHVADVTFSEKRISRIVINFKVDSRDQLWLLYTTSIRLEEGKVISLDAPPEKRLVNINSVLSLPTVVNLNPYKSYDKTATRTQRVCCISCAKETLDTMRHPVTYKTVMKHYEHLLHLIKEISGKGGKQVLDWPPDPEVIAAAGGVGFGCLEMVSEFDALAKATRMNLTGMGTLQSSELLIPPMLRYLHPKLTATGYHRCKMDPLFLYKTVNVCEACFLVYAEFTTMLLRLGQDLTKLLKPDPSAASLRTHSSLNRPSEADWKAMSTLNRSASAPGTISTGDFHHSKNHDKAKKAAIGIRSSEVRMPPNVPTIIRNGNELKSIVFADEATGLASGSVMSKSASLGAFGAGSASVIGSFAPDDIQAMIAERERRFFKEISLNPQLRDQHPLMHLISSQQKLDLADQASGVLLTKEVSRKEGLFGSKYGKQSVDNFDRLAPYTTEIPYVLGGRAVSPSKLKREKEMAKEKQRKEKEERRRRKKLRDQMAEAGELDSMSDASSRNSSLHHKFLLDTIKQVKSDVVSAADAATGEGDNLSPLKSRPEGNALSSTGPISIARPSTTSQSNRRIATAPSAGGHDGSKVRLVPGTLLEGDDESVENGLLRNWGVQGSAESSLDGQSFSRDMSAEQKLRDYGIGAYDSLSEGLRPAQDGMRGHESGFPHVLDLSRDNDSIGNSLQSD